MKYLDFTPGFNFILHPQESNYWNVLMKYLDFTPWFNFILHPQECNYCNVLTKYLDFTPEFNFILRPEECWLKLHLTYNTSYKKTNSKNEENSFISSMLRCNVKTENKHIHVRLLEELVLRTKLRYLRIHLNKPY